MTAQAIATATAHGTRQRTASPVGQLLQHWRQVRRMSQLTLATEAGVTPRHVSFVESGRSTPSRDMVLTLATTLDVPLRERNQLLLAAGYAPLYKDSGLDSVSMAPVRAAVQRLLRHHEPYPAVVMDRYWNVIETNEPATAMFGWLLEGTAPADGPANVIRMIFDPARLRPFVANWDEVGQSLVLRMHREAVGGVPDERTTALLEEALSMPDVPQRWRRPDFATALVPVVPVVFSKSDVTVRYFSMVTTVGTPQDITAQEIRVESFFPADDEAAEHRWR